jgi:hypothetical protein
MQPESFLDGLANGASSDNVVFFNQERVGQPQTMIRAAAAQNRIFQRGTQAGQGLRVSSSCVLVPSSKAT